MILFLCLLVGASCMPQLTTPPTHLRGKELRDHVNSHQTLWRLYRLMCTSHNASVEAEVPTRTRLNHLISVEHIKVPATANRSPHTNRHQPTTKSHLKTTTTKKPTTTKSPAKSATTTATPSITAANGFDARVQWPNCPSIGYIRDQSECGSCWAFAAAEVLSDRLCIASNAAKKPIISAQDIMTCCKGSCGSGCDGGVPYYAWEWLVSTGASTGGGYYENFGCKPYSVIPCGTHTVNGVTHSYTKSYCQTGADVSTPKCTSSCSNSAYNVSYASDKHFAESAYAVGTTVAAIQEEIMTNGPVEAAFNVYSDFDQYVSGIYVHTGGQLEGGHAVRILGWGTQSGTDYWLVANSWDTNWGENGFFRILRGVDECGIESGIVAGLPRV